MRKKFIASALGALAVISTLAVLLTRNVTPVSAQEILDRAHEARLQQTPTEGISHIRAEGFANYYGLSEDEWMNTTIDSYSDLKTGYNRTVITNSKTGKVLDAYSYDGTYAYYQNYSVERTGDEPLTIFRAPNDLSSMKKPVGNSVELNDQELFEQMRGAPDILSVTRETWEDGRQVYALQWRQPVEAVINGQSESPEASMIVYFDANTYKQIGYRVITEKDGQEILLASSKILTDEILPAETRVAWDLSDEQGIKIIDAPSDAQGDSLPTVVTADQASKGASAKNQTIYLLKEVPEGYKLEITTYLQQSANETYLYTAAYSTEQNDYFVIQSIPPDEVAVQMGDADETYTTVSGLVVTFTKDTSVVAIVQAPDGTAFMITSTLPRETVKAWVEELVPASK